MRVPVYLAATGINNKVPPQRLPWSEETGVTGLESASSVLIGKTGDIVAAHGCSLDMAGDYHSLFPFLGLGVVVKERTSDAAIYSLDMSGGHIAVTGLRSGLSKGRRMAWANVANRLLFYSNGVENGMIDNWTSWDWKSSTWYNADDSVATWSDPPVGEHLGYNAGRIFISVGTRLYFTEYGQYGLVDMARNAIDLPTRITMIAPTADGLYLSDQKNIYFMSGLNPMKWHQRQVTTYPAIEWAMHPGFVNPSQMGLETDAPSSLIGTREGPILLLPSGTVVNLTNRQLRMVDCDSTGAIYLFDETLIIQSTGG